MLTSRSRRNSSSSSGRFRGICTSTNGSGCMLNDLGYSPRMPKGVMQLQRAQLPADPEAFVREKLLNRERSFLDVAQRVIFRTAEHPFHRMFRLAGCEFGDLAAGVRRDGLERTLLRLRQEGVYLSHDEWKGKVPIVRSGEEIPA